MNLIHYSNRKWNTKERSTLRKEKREQLKTPQKKNAKSWKARMAEIDWFVSHSTNGSRFGLAQRRKWPRLLSCLFQRKEDLGWYLATETEKGAWCVWELLTTIRTPWLPVTPFPMRRLLLWCQCGGLQSTTPSRDKWWEPCFRLFSLRYAFLRLFYML